MSGAALPSGEDWESELWKCDWNVCNATIVNLKILTCICSYCVHHLSGNIDPTWLFLLENHCVALDVDA